MWTEERLLPYGLQGQIPKQTLETVVHSFWAERWRQTVNREEKTRETKEETTC